MKTITLTGFLFLFSILCFSGENKSQLPMQASNGGFIENKGQIIDQNNKPNPGVLFLLNTPGMNVQLRRGGFSYDLYRLSNIDQGDRYRERKQGIEEVLSSGTKYQTSSIQYHRVDFDLAGSNPNCEISTWGSSADYLNYYTTGTQVEGITSVHSYGKVIYKNIYPGIDLQFTTTDDGQFEYNFVLQPGADIDAIRLMVNGPESIKKHSEGLQFKTSIGSFDENIPVCYYTENGVWIPVKGRFKKIGDHLYGFAVNKTIPSDAVLLIDPIPTRRWGTYYYGGIWTGSANTDPLGNIIIAGETGPSAYIATAGAYQTTCGGLADAFLAKFSTTGQRIWGTYFGGSNSDNGYSCSVDKNGNIFLVGETSSTNGIATLGAHQTILRGTSDAFVAKFSSSGGRLWSTYYGGNEIIPPGWDRFTYCATDTLGNVFCAGETSSPDFISTPGAAQPTFGGVADGFLVKFTGDGQVLWGTYYGGSNQEQNIACAVTKDGSAFISGSTASPNNIATPGSFMPNAINNLNAFLARFNTDGQRIWGTYFGSLTSTDGTWSYGCCADTADNIYLFGGTSSNNNIGTPGVFQPTFNNSGGAYLEKFSSSGNRLWGTYYNNTQIWGAAVNDNGNVYLAGEEVNQDTLDYTPGAYQTVLNGPRDAIFAKFDGEGQRIWGTYYGGLSYDESYACATDHMNNVYFLGNTESDNNTSYEGLCTRNRNSNYIASNDGLYTEHLYTYAAFLVKFADCWSPDTALVIHGPSTLCQNTTGVVFSIDPIPTATDYNWCVTGNLTLTAGQHTTSITVDVGASLGMDTISVYGINSCDAGFPKVITRRIYPRPTPGIAGTDTTCTGIENVFTTEIGKSNYQWTLSPGGILVLGGTSADSACTVKWTIPGPNWIRINYADPSGCESLTPTQFNVWVNGGAVVSANIVADENPSCSGTNITFTASATNGGTAPSYQWIVNGSNAGSNLPTYNYTPANGDIVTCVINSSLAGCIENNPATSNNVVMTVNPNIPVSVSATTFTNPVCAGTSVTFTAQPVNEGTVPSYQWKVNGNLVGANLPTYTYIPLNGDGVTCTVNSNATCAVNNPATSPVLTMTVNPNLLVTVSIISSSNPFCAGSSVTFTATPNNGGTPPSYQWEVNGIGVGLNNQVYSYFPNNGDVVTCVLNSNIACPIGNPASSNVITMVVSANLPAGVSITATPNPFCPGSSVTFNATPTNGGSTPSYQWKVNGTNVGGNSNTYSYNPANNDSVRCVMTSNLSCVTGNPITSAKIIMSGTLAPLVTFTSCFDTITSVNAKPFKLKGGIPLGGTYSGPGVNSLTSVFTPSIAGIGTKLISYSYANAALCSAAKARNIIVQSAVPFTCGNTLTDIRDHTVYPTVQIGSQCWLASNLDYGTIIQDNIHQTDNCIPEKYHNPASSIQYPASVYQWDELMKYDDSPAGQGLCPPGWHVPTESDWTTLFSSYTSNAFAGYPLTHSGFSGFIALLSGVQHMNETWDFNGFATFFWSSDKDGTSRAWSHGMNSEDPSVSSYSASRANGFSVRCLKD